MRPPAIDAWGLLIGAGTLAYPAAVWIGSASVPPAAYVLAGLTLIALRLVSSRTISSNSVQRPEGVIRTEAITFLAAGIVLILILLFAPTNAAHAYPVVISLAFASVFAVSLVRPPTVVERIARLREPDLSPAGIAYTRRVTWVWLGFLLVNAGISAWTALQGSLEQWLLWNGLVSYLIMGGLFAGEFVVRRMVRG